jgi:Zn-dependent protease
MAPAPGFRLLGFPVTVSSGFVFGMLLLLGINLADPEFAVRLVVALAVFTVIHELGHALAARHFGADAAISLDFLVGYAVYRPHRPMAGWQHAVVSAAGPALQLAVGLAALAALGAWPPGRDEATASALTLAVWWAGPALALVNLLPLLPLDGGAIVARGVEAVVPGRGRTIVLWWSVGACAVLLTLVLTRDGWRPWAFAVTMLSIFSVQALLAERHNRPGARRHQVDLRGVAADAEREGWEHGRPGLFPPGFGPSPWLRAHALLAAGKDTTARALLVQSLERDTGAWAPPVGATTAQLGPLVELLPPDPPVSDGRGGVTLLAVLELVGPHERAARYRHRLLAAHPDLAGR